jgi:hypothetical protein
MKETLETAPLEVLCAQGWRAKPAGHFVRRVDGSREMLYPAKRGGWRYLRNGGWSRYLGETLADAVDALGLGEPRMIVEAVR